MKHLGFLLLLFIVGCAPRPKIPTLEISGLIGTVEVIRDEHGVNHIFATNEHDLFFAQGYCAAKDRLFQFELWRRQASGTVAEILGERELQRDIGARLFKFRGNLKAELNHYHPRGQSIIQAFTDGINAFIAQTENDPELLSPEFKLLGITPGFWTPDLVISRHQGLLGNLTDELAIARSVILLGKEKVKDVKVFEPCEPELTLDGVIDPQGLFENVIGPYEAFRKPITFTPNDLLAHCNRDMRQFNALVAEDQRGYEEMISAEHRTIGSNNWIVTGEKTITGLPLLANDPHRAVAAPSLRYMVHLNAPGWNVVGGGEPTIPGVSIGHNDHGAWGLTIFNIDGEDLMVYEINPHNPNQYKYKNGWEEMTLLQDTVRVKGSADVYVTHQYTRHGPVTFVDRKRNKAYAVRCAWLEPGGAPYLASLRMNTAITWEEFREACTYSHIPGENMIWADKTGNTGWQVVGIAPIRKNWSGLVPVPGDGRFEWDGYLPVKQLPHLHNPEKKFWATANENLVPENYEHRNSVGWEWADSSRAIRINAVLAENKKFSVADMQKLQFDYFSIPASELVPYLKKLTFPDRKLDSLRKIVTQWDFVLDKNSVEAGIYFAWEKQLRERAHTLFVPAEAQQWIKTVPLKKLIHWIKSDRPELNGRDTFMAICFTEAVKNLRLKLGADEKKWNYGQPLYHHVSIKHVLSNALNDSLQKIFNCGPLPRGGSGSTPGVTSNNDNQSHGATFRMVADLSDWNNTFFTNAPGQSGDIRSPFYNNLFNGWANDEHFMVPFSKEKIKAMATETILFTPKR